jgi:hypothetical protein
LEKGEGRRRSGENRMIAFESMKYAQVYTVNFTASLRNATSVTQGEKEL